MRTRLGRVFVAGKQKIRFLRSMDWRKIVGASLIGLVGLFTLRKGLPELGSILSLDGTIFRLLNQGLVVSFYITAIAPWIFQIFKLGDNRDNSHETLELYGN